VSQGCLYTKVAGRELVVWFLILIFSAVFIGSGLKFVTSFVRQRKLGIESVSWTPTPATIVRVVVRTGKRSDVTVVYRYSVNGVPYHSQRVAFGSVRKRDLMARASKYHPGDAISVFTNPQDPGAAVIETGPQPGNLIMPTLGAALMIIGVLIGAYVFWNTRPSSAWSRRNEKGPGDPTQGSRSVDSRP